MSRRSDSEKVEIWPNRAAVPQVGHSPILASVPRIEGDSNSCSPLNPPNLTKLAKVLKKPNNFSVRKGSNQPDQSPPQRMTHAEHSLERGESNEKKISDSSLPFLGNATLGKPLPQGPLVQTHSQQSAGKSNSKLFGADVTINPRASDDNQSGASIDSASRKRRMVAVNPLDLKKREDSFDVEKELAGTGTLKGMPGRLKLVRPSSRESANSFNGVSKQSIRSTHQEGIEPLSRNTSIQSIGPGNPKMVPTDKRALRHFEPQGAGIAFLGQNTTSAQQAQQKEEIVNKLGNTKRMNSGEGTIHLPSINAKPSDKSFNPNGTLKLVKPDTSQPSLGNGFRMRTAEADKRSAPGLGEPFGGPHQPRIMKQNVPYKPLSSHAPTRPNNLAIDTPKSDPKSSHLEHREIRKGPTSTGQNFFNSKGYTNQPENSMEPSTSQDNLFFDLDRSSNNPSLRVSDSNKKGLSFNDETNFESNTQEQRITLQYYESFGKTANLNEMCRNGGQAQSSLDQRMQNSGLSDKMNFTFGPNDLPKELLESNGRLDNNQTGNFPEQKSELVDKNNHWQISENMKKDGIKVSSSAIKIKNKEGNQISSFDPSSNKFKPTLEPRLVQENNYEPKALSRDHEERHERAVLEKDRIKIRPPSQAFKEPLQSPPKDPPKPRIPIKIVSSQRPLIQGSATQENPEVARQASKGKPPRIVPTKREEEMNSPQQDRQANPNTGLRSLTPGQEGVRPPQKLNSFATQLRPERLVVKRPQIE